MFLCFLTDHVMTIVGISPVMIFTNHALARIHSLWDPITQGWPHWSTRSAESGAASMFLMWFWNSRRFFFDEKTRLITSLSLSDLWWGFNASRLSLAPHMWHIPVQKKKRRPPPGQKSESKAVSFFTDRCASMPMVIRFLNGISRVLSHQITDWSACGGDKTRNALFCWLELAMLLHGDWILWIPMRANETCVNPVFIALILFERPNDYISWLIQVHGLSFSSQV